MWSAFAEKAPDHVIPPKPPLPAIKRLILEPASLTLTDARDSRGVLVSGERADGTRIDLTAEARFQVSGSTVKLDDEHRFHPLAASTTTLTVSAGGASAKLPVTLSGMVQHPVGFVRDIEPILARTGCNQGTCHGELSHSKVFDVAR
jgi:hypothetical protein